MLDVKEECEGGSDVADVVGLVVPCMRDVPSHEDERDVGVVGIPEGMGSSFVNVARLLKLRDGCIVLDDAWLEDDADFSAPLWTISVDGHGAYRFRHKLRNVAEREGIRHLVSFGENLCGCLADFVNLTAAPDLLG